MGTDIISDLAKKTDTKILYLIMDGLGDIPADGHDTPLAEAHTPNMDRLAREGTLGLCDPIAPGITPGSGPAHLSLFGYDPVENNVGRGLLSAFGLDFDLEPGDLAMRGNFCTIDDDGNVADRRAGRISDEENKKACKLILDNIEMPDNIKLFLKTESEHRVLVVLRGDGLAEEVEETDPQAAGVPPNPPRALTSEAKKSERVLTSMLDQIKKILKDNHPANFVLLRGYSNPLELPTFKDRYKLDALAIAEYPMYRGLAKLVGMKTLPAYKDFEDGISQLKKFWDDYDFFFFHVKKTDSYGEDGNFENKKKMIEEVDKGIVPAVIKLNPDVLVITCDHSTPWSLKAHSWHPVPVLFKSRHDRPDECKVFTEAECLKGSMGRHPSTDIMPLALAHAGKLEKFGA
ncbi:MAG TPA: 2,3-bisphosphoglycerate-independent phosphoglycerate mutase [candidate division Zixibacteria bacterium]|nr:2,3-bisphosphoglycerate-independent phosphoglycerate mutase [candidate division Zixibacteria bacterium]HEQ98183.1 2,3-bisphosphoglycerate-independent phosphoglycerate mutase [candidate division Zixibacteria bacterium]